MSRRFHACNSPKNHTHTHKHTHYIHKHIQTQAYTHTYEYIHARTRITNSAQRATHNEPTQRKSHNVCAQRERLTSAHKAYIATHTPTTWPHIAATHSTCEKNERTQHTHRFWGAHTRKSRQYTPDSGRTVPAAFEHARFSDDDCAFELQWRVALWPSARGSPSCLQHNLQIRCWYLTRVLT